MAVVNVLATMVPTVMMDSVGRRILMLVSSGGMLISTIAIVLALLGTLPKVMALASVAAFVGFFEIGLGPIPWLIVAEMVRAQQTLIFKGLHAPTHFCEALLRSTLRARTCSYGTSCLYRQPRPYPCKLIRTHM